MKMLLSNTLHSHSMVCWLPRHNNNDENDDKNDDKKSYFLLLCRQSGNCWTIEVTASGRKFTLFFTCNK